MLLLFTIKGLEIAICRTKLFLTFINPGMWLIDTGWNRLYNSSHYTSAQVRKTGSLQRASYVLSKNQLHATESQVERVKGVFTRGLKYVQIKKKRKGEGCLDERQNEN